MGVVGVVVGVVGGGVGGGGSVGSGGSGGSGGAVVGGGARQLQELVNARTTKRRTTSIGAGTCSSGIFGVCMVVTACMSTSSNQY